MPSDLGGNTRVLAGAVDDFDGAGCRIIKVQGKRIGVFKVGDKYVAYLDFCPHEGAPVCQGQRTSLKQSQKPSTGITVTRDDEILMCPWHGWEFDLLTGQCLTDRCKLLQYDVEIAEGYVYVLPRS